MAGSPVDGGGRITVVGLGRFGTSLARELHDLDYEVTVIDTDARLVESAADNVTLAAQGDATDEELLRSLDVERSHVAVVALGESIEASLVATLVLKRIGVPVVIATAKSELHDELLRRVGADRGAKGAVHVGIDPRAAYRRRHLPNPTAHGSRPH